MSHKYKISLVTGDGIGPEISESALNVLEAINDNFSLQHNCLDLITYVDDRLGHDRAYAINSSKFRKAFPKWKTTLSLAEYLREREHGFNWFNEHPI